MPKQSIRAHVAANPSIYQGGEQSFLNLSVSPRSLVPKLHKGKDKVDSKRATGAYEHTCECWKSKVAAFICASTTEERLKWGQGLKHVLLIINN